MINKIFKLMRQVFHCLPDDNYEVSHLFRKQGAVIGDDCYFGIRDLAGEPLLVTIGNHVQISSNVQLLTHNPGWCFRNEIPSLQSFGRIEIKDNCYIGTGAIILPDITIGPDSMVGAGSVVTKDVPPQNVVAGNPARVISTMAQYKEKIINKWQVQKPDGYIPELEDGKLYDSKYIHKLFHQEKNRSKLKKHLQKVLIK